MIFECVGWLLFAGLMSLLVGIGCGMSIQEHADKKEREKRSKP